MRKFSCSWKKSVQFIFLLSLMLLAVFSNSFAQDADELFRVVLVKGKPKRQDNKLLKDGQKILVKEKVLFTSLQDVVILMNSHFDRIYLRPKVKTDLKKLRAVAEFVPKSPQSVERSFTKTRGTDKSRNIQCLSDTLRIDLFPLTGNHPGRTVSDFKLYDVYMEEVKSDIRLEGNNLILTLPKTGVFILYCKESSRASEVLAEIEYLAKEEVLAELKFVASSVQNPESVLDEQMRYMERVYPFVSKDQIAMALNQK